MKRGEIVLVGFADAVPVACGMIGTICALLSAYRIEVSLLLLILFCVFSAILLSFWMTVPRYGFGFGALFLTCVIVLCAFRMQEIGDGAAALAWRVMDTLPDEIGGLLPMDALEAASSAVEDPIRCITLVLMPISTANGIMLAFSLIRSKTVLLPLLIPLPLLLASLIYTNMQPELWTILLVCVYFGSALLGNGLRKSESPKRGLFSLILAPALLALGLFVAAAFPQSDFTPISEETRKSFFIDSFSSITDTVMSWFGEKSPREVDLGDTGDRKKGGSELFSVYAKSGVYLLRTHSYGLYEDNRWRAAKPYQGEWNSMQALGERQGKPDSVMWIYDSVSDERIVPYAWTDDPVESDADSRLTRPVAEETYVHAGGWKDYGWRYTSRYDTKPGKITDAEADYYTNYVLKQYVLPDGEQKQALLDYAQSAGLHKSDDPLETARTVAAYVRNSGTYTLTPVKTPKGEDFVLYFLTKGHQGYCVHFASATTALLQAMGCPARYTVGYYAEIPQEQSGKKTPVTADAAHAWTEVYVPGTGWVPVESTPGRYTDAGTTGGTGTAPTVNHPTATPNPTPKTTPVPTPAQQTEQPTATQPTPDPTPAPTASPRTTQAPAVISKPSGGGGTDAAAKARGSAWWILIPLVPILWVGTGLLIRKRREARFRNTNIRRSIPDMARYLHFLERFGIPKDPDAEELALEAAFSDHRMKSVHRLLIKRVHDAQRAVYAKKPVLRFILKWVLYLI